MTLDQYVKEFRSRTKKFSLSGNEALIGAAYDAAGLGSKLLSSIRGCLNPLLKMGFETSEEVVQVTVEDTWFSMAFLSFGTESKHLQKARAIHFILPRLKQLGLVCDRLRFKLFYLPSLPAATTPEGHHMRTVNGFTNIDKERAEINLIPPRNYQAMFRVLVHEIIHLCILERTRNKEAEKVEPEIEAHLSVFFDKFSEDWKAAEKNLLEDLKGIVDKELVMFSKADAFLQSILDVPKSKTVIGTLQALFDAVLDGTVEVKPR